MICVFYVLYDNYNTFRNVKETKEGMRRKEKTTINMANSFTPLQYKTLQEWGKQTSKPRQNTSIVYVKNCFQKQFHIELNNMTSEDAYIYLKNSGFMHLCKKKKKEGFYLGSLFEGRVYMW